MTDRPSDPDRPGCRVRPADPSERDRRGKTNPMLRVAVGRWSGKNEPKVLELARTPQEKRTQRPAGRPDPPQEKTNPIRPRPTVAVKLIVDRHDPSPMNHPVRRYFLDTIAPTRVD